MKKNYTVSTAKAMIQRNRGKFEGKQIIIPPPGPGIKMLGAIDFLVARGFVYNFIPPEPRKKSFRQRMVDFRKELLISLITGKEEK